MKFGSAHSHKPSLLLVLATVFWGCGFAWAKDAGDGVNAAAGFPHEAGFGQIGILFVRFLLAGLTWMIVFPQARRGWTLASVARSGSIGALLGLGLILQHVGLGRTTEAVSAFLTSLTIIFVPIIGTVFLRQPPRPIVWVGVLLATIGIWLMTGATPRGFGTGEMLGVLCAAIFSIYLYALNAVVIHDSPWRLTGGQFLAIALVCLVTLPFVPHAREHLAPGDFLRLLTPTKVSLNLALLIVLPTVASFGIMTFQQPKVEPARAALIFLLEPIFAALYARLVVHRIFSGVELGGAALIFFANTFTELWPQRRPRRGQ